VREESKKDKRKERKIISRKGLTSAKNIQR
jgi:hypothetical protein